MVGYSSLSTFGVLYEPARAIPCVTTVQGGACYLVCNTDQTGGVMLSAVWSFLLDYPQSFLAIYALLAVAYINLRDYWEERHASD